MDIDVFNQKCWITCVCTTLHTASEYVEQSSAGSVLPMAPSLHSGLFMGGNILHRDGLHMCQVYKVQEPITCRWNITVQSNSPQEVEQQADKLTGVERTPVDMSGREGRGRTLWTGSWEEGRAQMTVVICCKGPRLKISDEGDEFRRKTSHLKDQRFIETKSNPI